MQHVSCLCIPWRNHQIPPGNTELKALSGDHATSPHPLWVIDPLGQVILLARHPTHNTTHSLISSYLSPGMQPLILKNTLSCNILGEPGSTLQEIGIPPHDSLTFVLKQGKEDKDLTYWRDLNKYVLSEWDFHCVFQIGHAEKKKQTCAGFAHSFSCFMFFMFFNRLSGCGGIASCFLASLYPHVCFHVRYDGKTSSISVVWVSHINHCAFSVLCFYLSDFLSLHQSIIALQPQRAIHPPWPKCDFYRKHVTNVQQNNFLSFLYHRETDQEPLKLYEKYIFMFYLMFPACHVSVPEAVGCCGSC